MTDEMMDDPVRFVLFGILRDLTNGMWQVSGEGCGGISRAFGEGLWEAVDDLIEIKSGGSEPKIDKSTPETALDGFLKMIKMYELCEEVTYELDGDSLVIQVKNCTLHPYTDSIDAQGTPRSIGCPYALSSVALMEQVTGELFVIDSIDSANGNSKIVIKQI